MRRCSVLPNVRAVSCVLRAKQEREVEQTQHFEAHIIVIGMNALGRQIVRRLVQRGETVLAIDTDPQKLRGLAGANTLIGNVEYDSVVEEIGLRRARMVISALQIEDANNLLAYRCRAARVPCAVHAFDDSVVGGLLDLNVNYLMMPAIDGAVQENRLMRDEGFLQSPQPILSALQEKEARKPHDRLRHSAYRSGTRFR